MYVKEKPTGNSENTSVVNVMFFCEQLFDLTNAIGCL